jgi:hypothetical protein
LKCKIIHLSKILLQGLFTITHILWGLFSIVSKLKNLRINFIYALGLKCKMCFFYLEFVLTRRDGARWGVGGRGSTGQGGARGGRRAGARRGASGTVDGEQGREESVRERERGEGERRELGLL